MTPIEVRRTTPEENIAFWDKHNKLFAMKLRAYYKLKEKDRPVCLDWLG